MATDQIVTAKDVLNSLQELRRQGHQQVLEDLEKQEPDLVEFLLEEISSIHAAILNLSGRPKQARRIMQRVETIAVVLLLSLRRAHQRLWSDQVEPESETQQLNTPATEQSPPAQPASDSESES